jgi:multicomponent Na+:H+ antiporter subunit D
MAVAALAVAVPIIASTLLAAVKPLHPPRRLVDLAAIGAAAAVAVLSAILLARSADGTVVLWFGAWTPGDGVALGVSFAVDPLSAAAALLAALLAVGALVFSVRYVAVSDDLYHALILVFLAGMVGFALSGDLFNLFVFFELLSVAAFVLAGYQIEQRAPLEGSLNFAIVNTVGTFLFLTGIALVYGRTGALNLAQIGEELSRQDPDALVAVSFALVASALFVKAAIVPFHFWLADAYAVARTPVCMLFAGVMSELGLYGIARVWWTAYSDALGDEGLRAILIAAGVLTALVGALMALVQTHLKRLLAFATISYLGLFLVGVGTLNSDGLAGAALFVAGDGFLKASLFACVGIVQHRLGHVDVRALHGRAREVPAIAALFALAALGVASLPPFGSFFGKALLEHGASTAGHGWVVAVFIAVAILTGAAILRAGGRVFLGLGEAEEFVDDSQGGGEPPGETEPGRTPAVMALPAAGFLGAALAVGLIPGIADAAVHAADRFLDRGAYAGEVLLGHGASTPAPPPDTGTHWYDWLYAATSCAGAVALAALLLLRSGAAETARRPLAGLRALHSGHPGDYVAFVVLGAAVLGGLCAVTMV